MRDLPWGMNLQLSAAEWKEIYYGLQQRVQSLDDELSRARIRTILVTIGAEGILAYQSGVKKGKTNGTRTR